MSTDTVDILRHRALCVHAGVASILNTATELDEDAIHNLRSAAKEIRGLWQLLQPLLDDSRAEQAIADLGEAAASLSAARDRYATSKVLTQLYHRRRSKNARRALQTALQRLQLADSGSGTHAPVSAELCASWTEDRSRWQTLEPEISSAELISIGYGRLYRKAHRCARKALANEEVRLWHRLRKWVKYLALTLPWAGGGHWLEGMCGDLRRTADKIGRLHDLERLLTALTALEWPDHESEQHAHVRHLISGEMDAALEDCAALAIKVFADKPRRFTHQLEAAARAQNM